MTPAKALGWDDWLKEVVPIFNGAGPLMLEAARRRNAPDIVVRFRR